MKLKFNTQFVLEKRKQINGDLKKRLKDGMITKDEFNIIQEQMPIITENVPILMFFTFDGERFQYFSGYRIDADKWDSEKQRVNRNNFNKDGISATDINTHLNTLQTYVEDIYKKAKANDINPSIEYIRENLKDRLNEVDKTTIKGFFECFNEFIEIEGKLKTWTKGTYTKFYTIIKHLKAFETNYRTKISFEKIDEKWFLNWLDFQWDVLKHRNSYVRKNLKNLMWFLRWTVKKGFNKNNYFEQFNPVLKGTKRDEKIVFLFWSELMHLYSLSISKKYLEQVRDVFCFMCFTGLRHSDVFNLKRSNIKTDTIDFTTIKTDDALVIELNDFSRAILEKYNSIHFAKEKALPVISNQKMNVYLKELGEFAGIDSPESDVYYIGVERFEESYKKYELLTTKAGRKTFVTNAFLFNIPAEVVMGWTGHSSAKMLEPYRKLVDKQKQREMNKFNEGDVL